MEAQAIRELVTTGVKRPIPPVGVSFSCRSNEQISDGTPLSACINVLANVPGIFAVGVNCTKPKYIPSLIDVLTNTLKQTSRNELAILLYPDGGEEWDAVARSWNSKQKVPVDAFGSSMAEWDRLCGATTRMILGGCCGTGPKHIASIRNHLLARQC